eukprot:2448649-Rhodomonas_salina.1
MHPALSQPQPLHYACDLWRPNTHHRSRYVGSGHRAGSLCRRPDTPARTRGVSCGLRIAELAERMGEERVVDHGGGQREEEGSGRAR